MLLCGLEYREDGVRTCHFDVLQGEQHNPPLFLCDLRPTLLYRQYRSNPLSLPASREFQTFLEDPISCLSRKHLTIRCLYDYIFRKHWSHFKVSAFLVVATDTSSLMCARHLDAIVETCGMVRSEGEAEVKVVMLGMGATVIITAVMDPGVDLLPIAGDPRIAAQHHGHP